MNILRKLVLVVLAMALPLGAANATILSGNFNISVYSASEAPADWVITSPESQANAANPLLSGTALYSGVYSGNIDFDSRRTNVGNNILKYLLSGSGSLSGDSSALNTTMSLSGFSLTTVFDITWFSPLTLGGTVLHDDGASLYVNNTIFMDASYPVSPTLTAFQAPNGGNYRLIHAMANGLPEVLKVDVTSSVPEPVTLALLGLGLVGLGFTKRRSKV